MKKTLSIILTITMLFSGLSVAFSASAANIAAGNGVGNGHYVYFGNSSQKWKVLNATKTSTDADGMWLISANSVATVTTSSNDYASNGFKTKCDEYYNGNNFSSAEKALIMATTKAQYQQTYTYLRGIKRNDITSSALDKAYMFLVSYHEVSSVEDYLPDSGSNRLATRTGTTHGNNQKSVVNYRNGIMDTHPVSEKRETFYIYPSFNLDTSKVLFTSAATNGKTDGLTAVSKSGSEWKLTLKDSNSFASGASVQNTNLCPGKSFTVSHKALSAVNSAYTNVTAAIYSGDTMVYYGSINTNKNATSSTITLPADIAAGTYTLKLFGETWNGDKKTDYATGTPYSTTITVKDHSFSNYSIIESTVGCTTDGQKTASCDYGCGETNTVTAEGSANGHNCTYAAVGNRVTAVCGKCGYSATAEITATDATFTGSPIKTAKVTYSDNWADDRPDIDYKDNTNVGTATASVTVGKQGGSRATFTVTFDITADYTAADKALADLEATLGDDTLTDDAKALYDEYKQTLESYKADKTTVQNDVNTLTANIEALKDNVADDTAVLPDYTAIDEAYETIVVPNGDTLTDEAQAKLNAIDDAVAEAKKSATQAELNAVEAGILADIKALTDVIADTSALKADYTEVDEAFASLVVPDGEELTDEADKAIEDIKAAIDALKAEDTSKTELDAADDDILADIKAVADAIDDTSALKADYTEVDEAFASLVAPQGEALTDEAVKAIEDIKAAIDALKAEDTSKTELDAADDDILADIKAVADAIDDTSALKADYTEVDEAIASLTAPEGEELTEEAVAVIADIKAAVDALKAEDTSKTELDAADDDIFADIKAVADAIADTSYLKADYTEVDEAIASLTAPEGEALIDEAVAVIADIKAAVDALKAEDTSKTELAEALVEINADIKAAEDAIADTSYIKANTTVADEIIAAIDETLAEGKFDDAEAIARIEAIKAEIEAIKADGNASMAEYQEKINSLIPELEGLYEYCQECEYCGNIHTSFFHEIICLFHMLINLISSLFNFTR